jgi:hypothetical protein
MTFRNASILATVAAVALPLAAAESSSTWPDRDLAKFVFEHLDISSFRNSTGPRRRTGQRTSKDLGVRPNRVSDVEAASDDNEWLYSVRILGRADYNKDGAQEVLICFQDMARDGGSYATVVHLVLQLVEGRAIALAFNDESRAEAAGCKREGPR